MSARVVAAWTCPPHVAPYLTPRERRLAARAGRPRAEALRVGRLRVVAGNLRLAEWDVVAARGAPPRSRWTWRCGRCSAAVVVEAERPGSIPLLPVQSVADHEVCPYGWGRSPWLVGGPRFVPALGDP